MFYTVLVTLFKKKKKTATGHFLLWHFSVPTHSWSYVDLYVQDLELKFLLFLTWAGKILGGSCSYSYQYLYFHFLVWLLGVSVCLLKAQLVLNLFDCQRMKYRCDIQYPIYFQLIMLRTVWCGSYSELWFRMTCIGKNIWKLNGHVRMSRAVFGVGADGAKCLLHSFIKFLLSFS